MRIAGRRMYLWHAVDQEGEILDLLTQPRRGRANCSASTALRPELAVTVKVRSRAAAFRALRLHLPS